MGRCTNDSRKQIKPHVAIGQRSRKGIVMAKKLTPMRAIRAKCLDCSCGNTAEVRECVIKDCALYPYRMGHRPKAEDLPTEEDEDE